MNTTLPGFLGLHHVAILCSDYPRAKHFYVDILGLHPINEQYRTERDSWKLDLALPDGSQLELFSFPEPPPRPSYPEACGLRHLALAVTDLQAAVAYLNAQGVPTETPRIDQSTGRWFTFFADPDGLPLELYESTSSNAVSKAARKY
jgi:glyoxylase I family protein